MKLTKIIGRDRLVGLSVVLVFHAAVLYGLWNFKMISSPLDNVTLMVNLVTPDAQEQSKRLELRKPRNLAPPSEISHLVAATPIVSPEEPVAYLPPPELSIVATPATPQMTLPSQPVMLTSELSVICTDRVAPNYPLVSKRMNEQGKAVLMVELGDDGKVYNASVASSSGFARLDDAALTAVKTWRCKPPARNGVAVRAVALQAFNFSLSE